MTDRTVGNPRPDGYGLFAHQRDQNWLARTPRFCDLNHRKGRDALNLFYTKKGRTNKKLFAVTKY